MADRLITLRNQHLVARFSPADGSLCHLSASGRGSGLIAATSARYLLMQDGRAPRWYSTGDRPDCSAIAPPSVVAGGESVTVTYASAHLRCVVQYRLPSDSPLLQIKSTVSGVGAAGGRMLALCAPEFRFTPTFNDQFEDTEDLYDDGAELAPGLERPCWRVFFRKGRRDGLLLAARAKLEMSHVNITAAAFQVQPQASLNYSTATYVGEKPLRVGSKRRYTATLELGPWTRAAHGSLLRQARLNEPTPVMHRPARGRPKGGLRGEIFHAADFARRTAVSAVCTKNKWHLVEVPWSQSGRALFATTGVTPPTITLDPRLSGLYHVYVGVGNGEGVTVRAGGDPETRIRINRLRPGHGTVCAWQLCLSGRHRPCEVDLGVIELDGRQLRLSRFPDTQRPCMIDYVRCVRLSRRQARQWREVEEGEPVLPLSGLADCPDLATLLDAREPDPRTVAGVIWEHANSKVNKVYWRIDGQCSDFPCKTNTMRYVSAKVHGVFSPHSKAYGRLLQRADILALAVAAGKAYGVEVWGWMRFNNYSGNVQSDFFRSHPQFHEEWENGAAAAKLCLAHPEVRRHKIEILIEAAKYGLDGINLGFLRHPPILLYAPILCDAYRERFGEPPPRDRNYPDPQHVRTLPRRRQQRAYERWWQFRAEYLTTFCRELKAALLANDLGHLRIAVWVRPNHCLFDGIDLPTWLDEGLCDEVVTMHYNSNVVDRELNWERPDWQKMVQAKVPLIRTLEPWLDAAQTAADLKRILAGGYDGICSYESNDTVLDSRFIELFRDLRRQPAAHSANPGLSANELPRGHTVAQRPFAS